MIAVFVPGALAGGLLVSIALLVGDLVRRVRGDAPARRAARNAADAAHAAIDGESPRDAREGLRSARVYGLIALFAWSLVALALPDASWNFVNPGGYISDIGLAWAVSMIAALGVSVVGAVALRLAPAWAAPIALVIGLGAIGRFVLGPEDIDRVAVAVVGIPVTAVVAAAAWVWSRRVTEDVPGWTRPLVRSTPLGISP